MVPPSDLGSNKVTKCAAWLRAANDGSDDPLVFLGRVLEGFMDYEIPASNFNIMEWQEGQQRLRKALARHALEYRFGGKIINARAGVSSKSLEALLRRRDFSTVDEEFERCLETVESDPRGALTAACSLLESLCKIYLEDEGLALPADKTIKPLWTIVSKHIGLDPSQLADDDLKRILSGLISVVDGMGALRTHAGTAHGQGRRTYRPEPRHARLAVNAAHTLATFLIETWEARKRATVRS
jgi:hypothetical protein